MKSRPMLLNKINLKEKYNPREVIGIIGTHHGTGVTHTGLMLAFYMGAESGKKTAYLECNNHHDFDLIQSAYEWSKEENFSFSFHQVTCFKEVSNNRIAEILNENYDCFIMDFGTDLTANREEFLRCGTKIVIGGRAEWDQLKLSRFIESVRSIRGCDQWVYFIPHASLKMITNFKRKWNLSIYGVPFQAEPTAPAKAVYRLFDTLFCYRGNRY